MVQPVILPRGQMSDFFGSHLSQHMHASVRRAGPEDTAGLARLRWQSRSQAERSREAEADFVVRFEVWAAAAIASQDWVVFVAETPERDIVGCMYVRRVESVPVPGSLRRAWGWVTNAFVQPMHRSQGIGSALLASLINAARELGLHELHVWPSTEAVTLYRRAGFLTPQQQVATGVQEVPAYLLPLARQP
jgi:GNAT superfamily N-acetyltransferase